MDKIEPVASEVDTAAVVEEASVVEDLLVPVEERTRNFEPDPKFIKEEKKYKEDKENIKAEFISLLMQHPQSVRAILDKMQKESMPGSEEEQLEYLDIVQEALRNHGVTDDKISPFGMDESDWGSRVEHEGRSIGISRPNAASMTKLTKESAVIKARASADLGTVATVPMWNTGTYISFKAPADIELLHLERSMAQSKVNLGRATSGIMLSATSIYFTMDIVNSALNNVFDTTAPKMGINELKETHLITDIPFIIGGYASAIYPDGYTLLRPCVADPNECNYIAEQEVSIPRMLKVDRSRLNAYQRNHMLDSKKQQTKETIELYQRNHSYKTTDVITTGDVTYNLAIPTIARYEEWSHRWIQDIVDHTREAFDESISANQRDNYRYQRAGVSGMMQYGHFVKSIYYADTGTEVTDYDTISEVLTELSGASAFRKNFMAKVKALISQGSISGVGIEAYDCPSCKKKPVNLHPTLNTIIQLEVAEVFFILMLRRLQNTLNQE